MKSREWRALLSMVGVVTLCATYLAVAAEPPMVPAGDNAATAAAPMPRLSLAAARERAQLLHTIYSTSLDVIHERYFHGERASVPARALEDVFRSVERETQIQARWISASFAPMSLGHEPKTGFEQSAARKLAKSEKFVETIEDGFYRRAGSISLSGGCVSCHGGVFAAQSTTPKFAGLIISIPVEAGATLAPQEVTSVK